jgi:hypothetical protein
VRLFRRKRHGPDSPPTYWNSSVVERIQRDAGVVDNAIWPVPIVLATAGDAPAATGGGGSSCGGGGG